MSININTAPFAHAELGFGSPYIGRKAVGLITDSFWRHVGNSAKESVALLQQNKPY